MVPWDAIQSAFPYHAKCFQDGLKFNCCSYSRKSWIPLMTLSELQFFISHTNSLPSFFLPALTFFFRHVEWFLQPSSHGMSIVSRDDLANISSAPHSNVPRARADIIQRWQLNGARAQQHTLVHPSLKAIHLFSKDLRPKGWCWNVFRSWILVLTGAQRASGYERRTPVHLKEADRKEMPIILTSADQRFYTNIQKYTD